MADAAANDCDGDNLKYDKQRERQYRLLLHRRDELQI
jgi:hypothetical protein